LQDIGNDGMYHPSVNSSFVVRVSVDFSPNDYPTDDMRAMGIVCGCGEYFENPCRAEFRKVHCSCI
jgi:hypothetical protein